ncbi:MAG: sigma-54-dependent Fis family transcriptional regulator [bacterium]|nr:sigma-54-dependent Fis family transcriptional regulator [bacterium]
MLEIFKSKIWDLLKEKAVSLAMVFDRDGHILWHKGRHIKGNSITRGEGFSKSYIKKCLDTGKGIDRENVVVTSPTERMSESALRLVIKCVLIHPLENDLFLYVDSGKKESFSASERERFKMLGDMLVEMIKQLKQQQEDPGGITGKSQAMENVRKMALNYAIVEEPILLKGETGVGKNHLVDRIHRYSGRKGKFVVVHTPSINEHLFESEIFGHKKGAFTDAKADQKGLVDEADGGTLFFDEISEIPLTFQTRLLRFMETKKYRVVGDAVEREADVRIVTATNKDLIKSIQKGEFREDLYYRLHVLEIEIPPLRERPRDIRALVEENMELLRGLPPGDGFWEAVLLHHWPGNVRELITFLKRAGIMLKGPITGEDVKALVGAGMPQKQGAADNEKSRRVWEAFEEGKSFWEILWPLFIGREVDRYFVKEILKKAYAMSSNNFKTMLKVINVKDEDYQKFMSLMYKYKIDPRN